MLPSIRTGATTPWRCTITEHEIVQEGVKKITYSNGAVIYVNYTNKDVTVDGVTVSAENFFVEVAE